MITVILPIKNMCGVKVGSARVTKNNLGKVKIEPITNSEFSSGLNFMRDHVHLGLWRAGA